MRRQLHKHSLPIPVPVCGVQATLLTSWSLLQREMRWELVALLKQSSMEGNDGRANRLRPRVCKSQRKLLLLSGCLAFCNQGCKPWPYNLCDSTLPVGLLCLSTQDCFGRRSGLSDDPFHDLDRETTKDSSYGKVGNTCRSCIKNETSSHSCNYYIRLYKLWGHKIQLKVYLLCQGRSSTFVIGLAIPFSTVLMKAQSKWVGWKMMGPCRGDRPKQQNNTRPYV